MTRAKDISKIVTDADLSGTLDVTGTVTVGDGAVGTPAISFASDTNTGIYRGGTDILKFVTAGTDAITIDASQNVDINGTVEADGLTVETTSGTVASFYDDNSGTIKVGNNTATAGNQASLFLNHNSIDGVRIVSEAIESFADAGSRTADLSISTRHNGNLRKRLNIGAGGDISFYEDTGTTPKLFWDASAERLGLGTTSPASHLEIKATSLNRDNGIALRGSGAN